MLANSAGQQPRDLPTPSQDTQGPVATDADDTIDNDPANTAATLNAPTYAGVKFCASVFTIMGGGLLLISLLLFIGTVILAMMYGLNMGTLVSLGVSFSFLLTSAIWLGAAFMMEMLRDLSRHLISQAKA